MRDNYLKTDPETQPLLHKTPSQWNKKRVLAGFIVTTAFILGGAGTAIWEILTRQKQHNTNNPFLKFLTEVAIMPDQNNGNESIPLSFYVTKNFWEWVCSDTDTHCDLISDKGIAAQTERIMATRGQDIYDAACWQIAESIADKPTIAEHQTAYLLSGHTADANPYSQTRAISVKGKPPTETFTYNGHYITNTFHAYFFRMLSLFGYDNPDPLAGWGSIPQDASAYWKDWKPITGENAWATLIGPLQTVFFKYGKKVENIPLNDPAVETLAHKTLSAFEAMQSGIGAVYYPTTDTSANQGTDQVNRYTVSLENNFSLLAGLKIYQDVLKPHYGESFSDGASVADEMVRVEKMINGILNFIKNYAFNHKKQYFYQGGYANDPNRTAVWEPITELFAVDVQTWGMTVLGHKTMEQLFGEDIIPVIWQQVKSNAGYYGENYNSSLPIKGVGYSNSHDILSAEWTYGAINMLKTLYGQTCHQKNLDSSTTQMCEDIKSMSAGMLELQASRFAQNQNASIPDWAKVSLPSGTDAMLYANKRYDIPFGWYANPIPSTTSTAWKIMDDNDFNPFQLGGARESIHWYNQTHTETAHAYDAATKYDNQHSSMLTYENILQPVFQITSHVMGLTALSAANGFAYSFAHDCIKKISTNEQQAYWRLKALRLFSVFAFSNSYCLPFFLEGVVEPILNYSGMSQSKTATLLAMLSIIYNIVLLAQNSQLALLMGLPLLALGMAAGAAGQFAAQQCTESLQIRPTQNVENSMPSVFSKKSLFSLFNNKQSEKIFEEETLACPPTLCVV